MEKLLVQAKEAFIKLEGRSDYFSLAEKLYKDGYIIEAVILILGTWNFAIFRYHLKEFDIPSVNVSIKEIITNSKHLEKENIQKIDLIKNKDVIIESFNKLASIDGIGYTGASKVLHLINKNLFIMWDGYIRGEKPAKYYKKIQLPKEYGILNYNKLGEGYFDFISKMKEIFQDVIWDDAETTLARVIDEYNYVNITLKIQEMEKEQKRIKKELQKLNEILETTR